MAAIDNEAEEVGGVVRRRVARKRRTIWKRRQFWIALIAIFFGILLVLWLISSLGAHHGEVE